MRIRIKLHWLGMVAFALAVMTDVRAEETDPCVSQQGEALRRWKEYMEVSDRSRKANYFPVPDIGQVSCLDRLLNARFDFGFRLDADVLTRLVESALNEACHAASSMVNEGLHQLDVGMDDMLRDLGVDPVLQGDFRRYSGSKTPTGPVTVHGQVQYGGRTTQVPVLPSSGSLGAFGQSGAQGSQGSQAGGKPEDSDLFGAMRGIFR